MRNENRHKQSAGTTLVITPLLPTEILHKEFAETFSCNGPGLATYVLCNDGDNKSPQVGIPSVISQRSMDYIKLCIEPKPNSPSTLCM